MFYSVGTWYGNFTFPGEDVVGTQLYGPNAPDESNPGYIEIVGCYTNHDKVNYAILYQGGLYGNGTWTVLTPQPLPFRDVGAIAHRFETAFNVH